MASTYNIYLFILITLVITPSIIKARLLSNPSVLSPELEPEPKANGLSLTARLKLEGENEPSRCWESLFELQACSGEVIMFFIKGETYLGPGCCEAIRVIGHDCWPNIIGTLGFTSEEGDILQGYCDSNQSVDHEPKKNMLP